MENTGLQQNHPNPTSSQVLTLFKKLKYFKCFVFFFLKKPNQNPQTTTTFHLHFWIVLTVVFLFISYWGQNQRDKHCQIHVSAMLLKPSENR